MPLPPALKSLIDDLAMFPDRAERIEALIDIGGGFVNPGSDEVLRSHATRVPGCESEVYLEAKPRGDGTLDFRYAVDNPQGISAMALAQILQEGLSGAPLDGVAAVSEEVVYEIFGRELSMGKSMGLTGMVKMAKAAAANAASAS